MASETKTIYIRGVPEAYHKRVRKIMGSRLLRNGKAHTKNELYLAIFEAGLDSLQKSK